MKFQVSDAVPLTPDQLFTLLRDDMPDLVPFLHDVEGIDVLQREENGDDVHIINLWRGSNSTVPSAARRFIKPEMLSWKDHAHWSTERREASWRLEPHVAAGIFECTGTTRVVVEGDHARIEIQGDLQIHADRVPGVPRLIARKLRPTIEQAILKQIQPNMENMAVSVRAWAAARD